MNIRRPEEWTKQEIKDAQELVRMWVTIEDLPYDFNSLISILLNIATKNLYDDEQINKAIYKIGKTGEYDLSNLIDKTKRTMRRNAVNACLANKFDDVVTTNRLIYNEACEACAESVSKLEIS